MNEHKPGPLLFAADLGGRAAGEVVRLEEDEIRHVRALRLVPGDMVRLTDGDGRMFSALVTTADRRDVECRLVEGLPVPAPLPIVLAFGVANKQSTLLLVEKAVEFGTATLQPIEFARSRSVADAGRSPAFWARARKRARAALKQSEGARIPTFEPVAEFGEWIQSRSGEAGPRILLDRSGDVLVDVLGSGPQRDAITILVGPEGGCTDGEVERAIEAGFVTAWLAPTILRLETAATAALAIVAQAYGVTER